MSKLTVFKKNETGSKEKYDSSDQKNTEGSSKTTAVSIEKPELLEISTFESEKTEKIEDKCSRMSSTEDTSSIQRKFDEYLLEAIDEALTSLGALVKNTIYFQLENNFNIPKNEIPKQIDEFADVMHKIFGIGASRLEIRFMKNLHSKIKVSIERHEFEWPLSKWIIDDISFTEYVKDMRENYCNSRQNAKILDN